MNNKKGTIVYGTIEKVSFPNKGLMYVNEGVPVVVPDSLTNQEVGVRLGRRRKVNGRGE